MKGPLAKLLRAQREGDTGENGFSSNYEKVSYFRKKGFGARRQSRGTRGRSAAGVGNMQRKTRRKIRSFPSGLGTHNTGDKRWVKEDLFGYVEVRGRGAP